MVTLVFCALLATASAIVFGFVYGIVILTVLFDHPLFWFAGLMLGPLAGAIGGPVFGVAYGAALMRRGRAKNRGRSALIAGVLGGVIFAAVGAGFHMWEASARSYRPTKRPVAVNPEGGRVATNQESRRIAANSGSVRIEATPEGGRVIEQQAHVTDASGPFGSVFASAGLMAIGGLLYGTLFGSICGTRLSNKNEVQNV